MEFTQEQLNAIELSKNPKTNEEKNSAISALKAAFPDADSFKFRWPGTSEEQTF
jgi:hypothetical protein